MRKSQKYLLAVSSGVLLWLAWPPLPFFPLLFLGFVPILWLEDECARSKRPVWSFFGYSYLALLIWNLLTTWWVGATVFGTKDISTAIAGVFANSANPLLMCIPLIGYQRTKKRLGERWGYVALVAYWITFEFIHLRWDLSWPWLTLGNGFSKFPEVVQWYEYTGVLGGTLWILATNVFIYELIKSRIRRPSKEQASQIKNYRTRQLLATAAVILVPLIVSLIIYYSYDQKGEKKEVVIAQPNVDPYIEKFDPKMFGRNLDKLIQLSKEKAGQSTDYLVWPETAIQESVIIDDREEDKSIAKVRAAFSAYPKLKIICGINAYAIYPEKKTATARHFKEGNYYWDAFNTAIQIDSSGVVPFYHKSKLVPGVEQMPYPKLFGFLEALTINMGGTSGSLGKQPYRSVFFSTDSTGVGPMICYESIYGEYSTEYVRRGSNLLFVITNDGWWGNTAGYKQHLEYARLRAIEARRDVAQSANTGISAVINQRGDVLQATGWWQPAVIKETMHANHEFTFYTLYGDYIGRAAVVITVFVMVYTFVQRFRKRKKVLSSGMVAVNASAE